MANLKLYEITNGFMKLLDDKETEELTEEEKEQIGKQLTEALQVKSANIIAYYQDQNTILNAIDEQIKRLQEYKKITKNKIDRYKEYVKSNMEALGIDKIQNELGTLSISKSPISVEVVDPEKIPPEYKQEVTEVKILKDKIKNDFKATGEIIDGVKIITDNTNLRIK